MKKSVYSLMLMDDVVAAIDQLAYSLNTSRSGLINQILAERVAYLTPEQYLQNVFNQLSTLLEPYNHFQIQNQAADHMYSVKSALRYKYNPTIRYSFYINLEEERLKGMLRVISRTQSEALWEVLDNFFKVWSTVENKQSAIRWEREAGAKWVRHLKLDAFQNVNLDKDLADALSDYIQLLDGGLKLYFKQIEMGYSSLSEMADYYNTYKGKFQI